MMESWEKALIQSLPNTSHKYNTSSQKVSAQNVGVQNIKKKYSMIPFINPISSGGCFNWKYSFSSQS